MKELLTQIKKIIVPLFLLCAALTSAAAQTIFQAPTNPAPTVTVWFTPSTGAGITNNFIYYGVSSGVYTNRTSIGTATNLVVTLPDRGLAFFFAASCQDNKGLQSKFSNEVSYTPPSPPAAPTMQPIIVLTVQSSPAATGMYADTLMNWSLAPADAEMFYKLRINRSFIASTTLPPMPSK